MNNKGFTMVELLAAIAILALLVVMAFPTMRALQGRNEKNKFQEYGKAMISAAKLYADSYYDDLFPSGRKNDYAVVSSKDLLKKDLLKDISVSDASCINDDSYVTVAKYKDDFEYCLNLKCTSSKSASSVLYTESNTEGICKSFKTVQVNYYHKVNGAIVASHTDHVIAGDDEYYVKNASVFGYDYAAHHQKFKNWKVEGGSTKYNEGQKVSSSVLSDDLKLETEIELYKYTIAFSGGNGSSGNTNSITCDFDVPCTLPSNSFTKSGATFTGWTFNGHTYQPGDKVTNLTNTNDGSVTLTATWRVNQLKIRYNLSGGSIVAGGPSEFSSVNSVVYKNGAIYEHVVNKGASFDLCNYHNPSWIYSEYGCRVAVDGAEWSYGNKNFDEDVSYTTDNFINLDSGDKTITVTLNWTTTTRTQAVYYINYISKNCKKGSSNTDHDSTGDPYKGRPYRKYLQQKYECTCYLNPNGKSCGSQTTDPPLVNQHNMKIFYKKTDAGVSSCKNENGYRHNQNVYTLCINSSLTFDASGAGLYHGYMWYNYNAGDSVYHSFGSGWTHSGGKYDVRYKTGTDLPNNATERKAACNHACATIY